MNTRDGETGAVQRWAMPRWFLPGAVLALSVLLVFGPIISVSIIRREGWPGALFMAAWFGALAWNVYWWMFRVAYRLELEGDELRWRAPLARGRLSVSSITGVSPFMGVGNQMLSIQAAGLRSVQVFAYGDLSSFLARMSPMNPAVPAHIAGFAGVYDGVSGGKSLISQLRRVRGK